MFDVLQEHGIAQPTADGKAIWRATVQSDTGWTHSFTFLRLAPSVIWEPNERPAPFQGTVRVEPCAEERRESGAIEAPASASTASPSTAASISIRPPVRADYSDAVGSVLALLDNAPGLPPILAEIPATSTSGKPSFHPAPSPQSTGADHSLPSAAPIDNASGARFVDWLRESVRARRLVINEAKALVHTVAGTVFLVSPGLFQRYLQEHPAMARAAGTERLGDWQRVQKQFEHMHLHKNQPDGRNIWTCEVAGPRRTRQLHGYLLIEPSTLFEETPFDNPFLKLLTEARGPKPDAADVPSRGVRVFRFSSSDPSLTSVSVGQTRSPEGPRSLQRRSS